MTLVAREKFELTPTGVVVHGEPTFGEWLEAMALLTSLREQLPIIIGDMLVYGETHYGEVFAQAVGYAPQTMLNYASVMRRVPPEVRREGLKYAHYEAVSSLPLPEQKRLLLRAVEEDLTREDLRQAARVIQGRPAAKRYVAECEMALESKSPGYDIVLTPDMETVEGDLPMGRVKVIIKSMGG